MALGFERARELAVLRAQGFTPGQVWTLVTGQSGLMGAAAGILAIPVGIALSVILVFVINQRTFGWTLQLELAPGMLIQGVALAVVAALAGQHRSRPTERAAVASGGPARRMKRLLLVLGGAALLLGDRADRHAPGRGASARGERGDRDGPGRVRRRDMRERSSHGPSCSPRITDRIRRTGPSGGTTRATWPRPPGVASAFSSPSSVSRRRRRRRRGHRHGPPPRSTWRTSPSPMSLGSASIPPCVSCGAPSGSPAPPFGPSVSGPRTGRSTVKGRARFPMRLRAVGGQCRPRSRPGGGQADHAAG